MAQGSLNGDARAVVLVEGRSDRAALAVLAVRRGMDLAAAGIEIVSMEGITNIGHYLDLYRGRREVRVTGLYDDAEERFVRRGLCRVGLDEEPERLGFYACSPDLEDELIRALGPSAVEEIVAARGELRSFRTLQRQPAQRARSLHDQLRRLMSGRAGGKERYAAAMAAAVPLDRVPRPLDAVLTHVYRGIGDPGDTVRPERR